MITSLLSFVFPFFNEHIFYLNKSPVIKKAENTSKSQTIIQAVFIRSDNRLLQEVIRINDFVSGRGIKQE